MPEDVTIVISEDDQGHFILMKHRLKHAGMTNDIIWLSDGQRTLDFLYARNGEQKIQDHKKYIILLDIRMPKIDGIEVLQRIKRDDQLKHIPVLIVTSSDHPDNIRRCTELGCDGYIIKPLDDNDVQLIQSLTQPA